MLHFEKSQIILSFISLQIICACNLLKSTSTPFSSLLQIYPMNPGFQQSPSHSYPHTPATHRSLVVVIKSNTGKAFPNDSSPHHLSIQNFTIQPFFHPKNRSPLNVVLAKLTPCPSLTPLEDQLPSISPYFTKMEFV